MSDRPRSVAGAARLLAWEFTVPVLVIAAWWILSAQSTSFFFPPLSEIVHRFGEVWFTDRITHDFLPSVRNLLVGFGLAAFVGISLGVVLGLLRPVQNTVSPVLEFLRALPAVALLPILIQLLGIGISMKVGVIFLGAVWPVLLNTIDGVRAIDTTVWDLARSYRLSWKDRIFRVILPGAAPQTFVGLRASLSVSVILLLASELYGSSSGIGHYVLQAQREFAITDMWTGMILLGILGYVLNLLLLLIGRRVLKWQYLRLAQNKAGQSSAGVRRRTSKNQLPTDAPAAQKVDA